MLFRRMVEEKEARKNSSNDNYGKKNQKEVKLSGEDLKEALERVKPLWLKRK